MCFGIRILSPFHVATLILPIENHKYPENTKNACADALIGLFCGQFSSKENTIASLLQVTSISVYNTVRSLQQRQGTPPVQEVIWKFIDLKLSSPEKWLISCKHGHLLIKALLVRPSGCPRRVNTSKNHHLGDFSNFYLIEKKGKVVGKNCCFAPQVIGGRRNHFHPVKIWHWLK